MWIYRNTSRSLFTMLRIGFIIILLRSITAEMRESLGTNSTTTFTGLQDDYNFGHIGYVHLSSDSPIPELEISNCQTYDLNQTTCSFVDKGPKSDGNIMVIRAWTALTLRENMLVLLGYLMHHPRSEERFPGGGSFGPEVMSSLRLLYDEIRRNNVPVMDLVPRLKSLAKMGQASQVLSLFKSLHNIVSPFCRSAVDELSKYFSKRKEYLRNVLNAQKGLDLFADIGLQMVPMLKMKNLRKTFDRDIEATMGKEFAMFFAAVQQGRVVLTQPVLAILMLNMKFPEFTPAESERFRFLCDALRLHKVPNWSPAFSGTCCSNFKDPYVLVQSMLKTISERPKVDPVVRRLIDELLPRLVKVPKADVASERLDQFFGHSNFNVTLFLEALEDYSNGPDVTALRRIINDGSIKLAYAFKGFIRYSYDTTRKLVQALIERIRLRVPMTDKAKNLVDRIIAQFLPGR